MPNPVTVASQPVPLQGVNAPGYDAQSVRRALSVGRVEGVFGPSDFVVQQSSPAAMTVNVLQGEAFVQGDTVARQGRYYVVLDADLTGANAVTISTADATNPRVDIIVLEVKDNAVDSSGLSIARVRAISGTPTAGATLTNRSGAPSLPATCLWLADVLVPATSNAVITANISDKRTRADFAASGTVGTTSLADGSATNAKIADGAINQQKMATDVQPLPGDLKLTARPIVAGADPTGWLFCDGRTVSRTTYAALFAAISTTYGSGDGSTTFNLPDYRGRTFVGPDNMGTAAGAANRIPNSNRALGQVGGEERHVIAIAELPAHNHGVTDPGHQHTGTTGSMNRNAMHQHSFQGGWWLPMASAQWGYRTPNDGGGSAKYPSLVTGTTVSVQTTDGASVDHEHTFTTSKVGTGITTNNTGSGTAANVMQPYQVANVLIKT